MAHSESEGVRTSGAGTEAVAPTLRAKAEAVVAEMANRPGLSPLVNDQSFLDFVMELLLQLLPVLIGCFGGTAGAAKELKNPRLLTRVRLRMIVRRELGDAATFRVLGEPLADAVLKLGRESTAAELEALSS